MQKTETLSDFYKRKFDWIPDNILRDIGHFNVFKLDPFVGKNASPVPYKRRDYYKIMLVMGKGTVHYADRIVEVQQQALSFSNPMIPYKWEHTDQIQGGYFCVFNRHFFHQYANLEQYSVFQPGGPHIFELSNEQVRTVSNLFIRMFDEINSDYIHKYDVLKTFVLELIHFAMKMQPGSNLVQHHKNASERISTLFLELLERQFPIDDNHQTISLRSPSDYARQLNIHVNHLNRAIKETTEKTTSNLIADRILREAKILLKHSPWSISEISDSLGFSEVTHFTNFFKKHVEQSPLKFRNN